LGAVPAVPVSPEPRCSLGYRSPASKDPGSFRHELGPLQSSFPTSLVRPARRPDPTLHEVCAPYNGIQREAPCQRIGRAQANRVPLTGFLNPSAVSATRRSTALFHAATVPERSLQSFPLVRDRVPLSRPLAPFGYPPVCRNAPPGPYRRWFHRLPRLTRSPGFAQRLWAQFSRVRRHASRSPWVTCSGVAPFRQLHPLRSFSPSVESVRVDPGCPDPTAAALLGFRPSNDQTFQASEPRPTRPRGTNTDLRPKAPVSDPRDSSPSSRVRPNQRPKTLGRPRRQSPALFRTGPRRLSTAFPSPLTF